MILPVTRGDFTFFFLALNVCVLSGPTETTHCLTFLTFIKICSAKVGLWILAVPEIRLWVSLGAFPFCSMKSPFSFFYLVFLCSDSSGRAGQEGDSMEEGELESE